MAPRKQYRKRHFLEIRCSSCGKLLANGQYGLIEIKCPRCNYKDIYKISQQYRFPFVSHSNEPVVITRVNELQLKSNESEERLLIEEEVK